jgi:hypothetical protein
MKQAGPGSGESCGEMYMNRFIKVQSFTGLVDHMTYLFCRVEHLVKEYDMVKTESYYAAKKLSNSSNLTG